MSEQTLKQLEQAFQACPDVRFFSAPSGLTMVAVDNSHATATLCLQGAHLCRFTLKSAVGSGDLLWLSDTAQMVPGKAIRGGVPICWPWFGAHATQPELPSHGFARTAMWQLDRCTTLADGATELSLLLNDDDASCLLWPFHFELRLTLTLGKRLTLALTTRNCDSQSFVVGGALHSYFAVGDIDHTDIEGLDGVRYSDAVTGQNDLQQSGPVNIVAETDRIYRQAPSSCKINDRQNRRQLHIATQGSRTTVVWNPWHKRATAMADFDNDGYRNMLCVEAVNCGCDVVSLAPGEQHTLLQQIDVSFG